MTLRRNPLAEPQALQPPDIYSSLRVAEKRERSRQWERAHLSHKAMYRGVDPQLALRVKQIAASLQVAGGEVARALLEYALRAYAEGDLDLHPQLNPLGMRMTLYPKKDASVICRKRSEKKPNGESTWRVIVTWRGFPPELKQEIAALSSDDGLNVPAGELVTALLRFGLQAHEYGLLKLEPVPLVLGYSLFEGVL